MSKIEVNKIGPQCGTTLTVGCGAGQTVVADAATVTLGRCGGTVALASGASQTGFGRTGTVNWVTTKKTTGFTAVSGEGYFCDTAASGAFTLTLPSSPSAGDIVGLKDYNNNFATANLTIGRGGSPINGVNTEDPAISTSGASIFLVYVDASQGWVATQDDSSTLSGGSFVTATGGTTSDCGDFRTHRFTGPGTFCVSAISTSAANNKIDYLVVAGGGSGGSSGPAGSGSGVGGGGAGGFRLANSLGLPAPTMSPLANPTGLTATVGSFTIAVGGGGPAGASGNNNGNKGSDSVFSSITSTGGGYGAFATPGGPGGSGGSGGGSGYNTPGGSGNTPPVNPPQGNAGGNLSSTGAQYSATGGGGAGGAGVTNPANNIGGAGGPGSFISDTFVGSPAPGFGTPGPVSSTRYFAGGGGGGGGIDCGPSGTGGAGGTGGGGAGGNSGSGAPASQGGAGTINTGGGGGGAGGTPNPTGTGGSGIVIIRYKFQ